jgi:DNA-binding XRE family transcriptional regulator
MNARVQILKNGGEAAFAVLPVQDYEDLLRRARLSAEDIEDIAAIVAARRQEQLPAAMVKSVVLGRKSRLAAWREFRGLAPARLAAAAGLSASYLSQLENRRKAGTLKAYRALARALRCRLEDIAPAR